MSAQAENEVELGDDVAQHGFGARSSRYREAVDVGAPDKNSGGTEREGGERVGARANAAVEQHGDAALHALRHRHEGIERGRRTVDLPPSVVGDDDAVNAVSDGELRVIRVLDALEKNGQLGALAPSR